MFRPNNTQLAVGSIFLVQLIFALVISPMTGMSNLYPLHQWSLFGQVRKNYSFPIMYIHEWGDKIIEPPQNYHDFFKGYKGMDFLPGQDTIFDWYLFTKDNKLPEAEHKQRTFEKHFFKNVDRAVYSLNIERLNQLEYRKSRKITFTEKTFGPFVYEGGIKK